MITKINSFCLSTILIIHGLKFCKEVIDVNRTTQLLKSGINFIVLKIIFQVVIQM